MLSKYFRMSIFKYQSPGREKCNGRGQSPRPAPCLSAGVAVVDLVRLEVRLEDVHDRVMRHAVAEGSGQIIRSFGS